MVRHRPQPADQEVAVEASLDPKPITQAVRAALDAAEAFAARMPTDKLGLVFLAPDGIQVEPDPDRLGDYVEHRGARRGHWPSSSKITQAMFAQLYGSYA